MPAAPARPCRPCEGNRTRFSPPPAGLRRERADQSHASSELGLLALAPLARCLGLDARPKHLAGLAVGLVLPAVGAVLLQLQAVRIVPPVLPRDVVAVLALLAGQRDLGPYVGGSHDGV